MNQVSAEKLVEEHMYLVPQLARKVQQRFPLHSTNREDLISVGHWGLFQASLRFDSSKGFTFCSFAASWIRGVMTECMLEPEGTPTSGKAFFVDVDDVSSTLTDKGRSLDTKVYWSEVQSVLAKAVNKLPKHLQEIIVLRYWVGSSFSDIGKMLQVPSGTIKTRHLRALSLLKSDAGDLFHQSVKERTRTYSCPKCSSPETSPAGSKKPNVRRRRCQHCNHLFVVNSIGRGFERHRHLAVV